LREDAVAERHADRHGSDHDHRAHGYSCRFHV
jgi:hypothetical protein